MYLEQGHAILSTIHVQHYGKTEYLAGFALPTLDEAKHSLVNQVKSMGTLQELALLIDKQVNAAVRNALFQLILIYTLASYLYNPGDLVWPSVGVGRTVILFLRSNDG